MTLERFGEERKALVFGQQKINVHVKGHEIEPKAHLPVPSTLDICFIARLPLNEIMANLKQKEVVIKQEPVKRTGATGPIRSIYLRDSDLNLIEISEPLL